MNPTRRQRQVNNSSEPVEFAETFDKRPKTNVSFLLFNRCKIRRDQSVRILTKIRQQIPVVQDSQWVS